MSSSRSSDTIAREQVGINKFPLGFCSRTNSPLFFSFSKFVKVRRHRNWTSRRTKVSLGARVFQIEYRFSSFVSVPRQQTFQFSSETVLVIFFHVLFTIFVFGRFTMNNGALLREIFYALIDTSNETLNQPTSFSPTNYWIFGSEFCLSTLTLKNFFFYKIENDEKFFVFFCSFSIWTLALKTRKDNVAASSIFIEENCSRELLNRISIKRLVFFKTKNKILIYLFFDVVLTFFY